MSSSKGKARERQLARAKYERQLSRRAASARHRRQWIAGMTVLVLVLAGIGLAWWLGAFDSDEADQQPDTEVTVPAEDPVDEPSGDTESPADEGAGDEDGSADESDPDAGNSSEDGS